MRWPPAWRLWRACRGRRRGGVSLASAVGLCLPGIVDTRLVYVRRVAQAAPEKTLSSLLGRCFSPDSGSGERVGAEAPPTTARPPEQAIVPIARPLTVGAHQQIASTADATPLVTQAPFPHSSNPNTSTPSGGMVSDSEAGWPWAPMVSVRTLPPLPVLLPP